MEDIFKWVQGHWGFCAFCIAAVIQITPAIKWNPITAFVKWLGKVIIQPAMDKLGKMQDEIEEIKSEQKLLRAERKADEKDRIRYEVLEFANSCRNNRRHTRDEFQHIIDMNDKYERLLKETNDTNGVFTEEYKYILNLYHKCQAENDFLT